MVIDLLSPRLWYAEVQFGPVRSGPVGLSSLFDSKRYSLAATRSASGTATLAAPIIRRMELTASQCLAASNPAGRTQPAGGAGGAAASSAFMMTRGATPIVVVVVVVIGSSMPSRLQHRCHHHHHEKEEQEHHHGSGSIVHCSMLCCILCVCKLPWQWHWLQQQQQQHRENQEKASVASSTSSTSISSCGNGFPSRQHKKEKDNKEIWLVKRLKLNCCTGTGFFRSTKEGEEKQGKRGKKSIFKLVFPLLLSRSQSKLSSIKQNNLLDMCRN